MAIIFSLDRHIGDICTQYVKGHCQSRLCTTDCTIHHIAHATTEGRLVAHMVCTHELLSFSEGSTEEIEKKRATRT
jgi:hypothetical protein